MIWNYSTIWLQHEAESTTTVTMTPIISSVELSCMYKCNPQYVVFTVTVLHEAIQHKGVTMPNYVILTKVKYRTR